MSLPESYAEIAITVGRKPKRWEERRVTRSGIRRFLMACAPTGAEYPTPSWYRLWLQIEWTREQARTLRVVIPPNLWDEDKARLAAKIISSPDDANRREERARALRWARR